MSNQISRAFPNSYAADWSNDIDAAALNYCKTARTVTAGAVCDEHTVISDACRSSSNDVDAFVCDDAKMAAAQQTIGGYVKDLVLTIVGVFAGRP